MKKKIILYIIDVLQHIIVKLRKLAVPAGRNDEGLTLDELYSCILDMWLVKENRSKKVAACIWSKKQQSGACAFAKVGAVTYAANFWTTLEETETVPEIWIDEL